MSAINNCRLLNKSKLGHRTIANELGRAGKSAGSKTIYENFQSGSVNTVEPTRPLRIASLMFSNTALEVNKFPLFYDRH